MALNVSILAIPLPVFLVALVLILAVIVALTFVEVRLAKKAKAKKEYEETYYQKKLSAIAALTADQNSFLISLDKVAREFFSEEVGMKTMGKYTQLIDELRKRNLVREVAFCQRMQEALYSGEKFNQSFMQRLLSEMRDFVLKREKRVLVEVRAEKAAVQQTLPARDASLEVNENILRYVYEGRKRGFEFGDLKKKLLEAGFDEVEIDKVERYLIQKVEKQKMPASVEKRILTNFLNPQKGDIEIIKRGVEEKDELGKAEIIEIVPYKKEVVAKQKVNYPKVEPDSYKQIGSLDNLDRIKSKIDSQKKGVIAG